MKQNRKNKIAIIGFILSFFISLPGLIISTIGLKKSKDLNEGKGFSIAGIVISSLKLILILFIIILLVLINYFGHNGLELNYDNVSETVENH